MTMTTRRELLAQASAAGLALALNGTATRTVANQISASPDPRLAALLDRLSVSMLNDYPDAATTLGLDTGVHSGLRERLPDRSIAGDAKLADACRARLKELRAFDASKLAGLDAVNLECALYAHELAAEGYDHFHFGDNTLLNTWRAEQSTPYVVSQGSGFFATIPDLMVSQHKIENAGDAEAYLKRLSAFAQGLDGENERLQHDAGKGVIAPDFVLDTTLAQQSAYLATPIAQWELVTSLAHRASDKSLAGDWEARVRKLCESVVAPAVLRQINTLKELRARATGDAGVGKFPQGEAYYRWMLKMGTTTDKTPEEVHRLGLEQAALISGQMDQLLRKQGLSSGSVGDRMGALNKDPRFLFSNDDAGRAQLLAYLSGLVADMRTRLPRAFATLKKADLLIKRVPPSIQDGMPGGYEEDGPIDESAPASYYINLRNTAIWPKFTLPTLSYHEGIPGHVWQGTFVHDLPNIRSQLAFNAYIEGWALYAEQLADELGAYDADPYGRLGYLQSMQFRACRLVVDTGLHAKGWSRKQANVWMTEHTGSPVDEVAHEVDRYCVWPGQACGYKVGQLQINALRDRAKAALGGRFDLRKFNDAVLTSGNLPLTVLDKVMERFIAAA
jgi:uncharacterized protein (DUF885 family)